MPRPATVPGLIRLEPPDGIGVVVGVAVDAAALAADGVGCPLERAVGEVNWVFVELEVNVA